MQQMEIERKFILKEFPLELQSQSRAVHIRQGYLILEKVDELRLRQKGEKFWLTHKQGSGLQRVERECAISEEQFRFLWPLTQGRRVEKIRHIFSWKDYTMEVDIFSGALSPLLLLEVEFSSLAESRRFSPPDWAGEEVTNNPHFRNATLAVQGLPK